MCLPPARGGGGHLRGTHPLEAAAGGALHRAQSATLSHNSRDLQKAGNPMSVVRNRRNMWPLEWAGLGLGASSHGVTRTWCLRLDEVPPSEQTRNVWVLCNVWMGTVNEHVGRSGAGRKGDWEESSNWGSTGTASIVSLLMIPGMLFSPCFALIYLWIAWHSDTVVTFRAVLRKTFPNTIISSHFNKHQFLS